MGTFASLHTTNDPDVQTVALVAARATRLDGDKSKLENPLPNTVKYTPPE
jgi:hypothetical protein